MGEKGCGSGDRNETIWEGRKAAREEEEEVAEFADMAWREEKKGTRISPTWLLPVSSSWGLLRDKSMSVTLLLQDQIPNQPAGSNRGDDDKNQGSQNCT